MLSLILNGIGPSILYNSYYSFYLLSSGVGDFISYGLYLPYLRSGNAVVLAMRLC